LSNIDNKYHPGFLKVPHTLFYLLLLNLNLVPQFIFRNWI